MNGFAIPPEYCLILKAFRDSDSLREAAVLLNCDPAGLARRVQAISRQHGLLQKVNNRWQLTARGLDLVAWVEHSIESQKAIVSAKSGLRIASTSWFGESKIIPHLHKLKAMIGDDTSVSVSVPDKGFEHALLGGAVDFVIVCHPPENPEIEHRQIAAEKWVVVAPKPWQKDLKGKDLSFLKNRPFVRHADLNEDLFCPDLDIQEAGIVIDNLIGVRSAVKAGLGWSFVPEILVHQELQDGSLIKIPYEVPVRDRKVCLWWLRNRYDTKRFSGKLSTWIKEACS